MSQNTRILNASELETLYRGLRENEFLVISPSGSVYKTSRLNEERLKDLQGKIPSRKSSRLDTGGFKELMKTRSWVESHGKAFKNFWDNIRKPTREKFYSDKDGNLFPMVELWVEYLEGLSVETAEKIKVNFLKSDSYHYMEVSLPGYPVIIGFSVDSGKARYYIFKGQVTMF